MTKANQIETPEIVKYSPPARANFPTNEPMTKLLNLDIVIKSVKVENSAKFGKIALVELDNGNFYRTTSKVLVDQLENGVKPITDSGKLVAGRISRVKQYYTFTA